MKFCKDCKHYIHKQMPFIPLCRHPDWLDPVEGIPVYAATLRYFGAACGKEAKLFEAKTTEPSKEPSKRWWQILG